MRKAFYLLFLMAFAFSISAEERKAPELAFNLPGQGQKLLSQYRGKVVGLEFILTTCPHCQAQSKVMTKFQNEFAGKGFQALDLAINLLDNGGTAESANSAATMFSQKFEVGFPVGWLPREQMMAFEGFSLMDRMVVPQLVLIDRKGVIRYSTPAGSGPEWEAQMNEAALHQHIEELVNETAPKSTARTLRQKSTHVASVAK
jgi:peroxiredoxin